MKKLVWNDGMSVGVESMDNDHKQLISLISELNTVIETGVTDELCSEIFDELTEYINIHFKREEALMRAAGYVDYENHLQQHVIFASEIPKLKDKLLTSDSAEVALEVNLFLYQWLTSHILVEDMSYAQTVFDHGLATIDKKPEGAIKRIIEKINSRLSFTWRMMLTTVIPMTSVLILSFLISINGYQEYQSLKKLKGLNELIEEVSGAVHNLQIERGLSTGYLSSRKKPFREELNKQRATTDQSLLTTNTFY